MRRFLKEEVGVKVPIVGTIVATSTPNLMADLDVGGLARLLAASAIPRQAVGHGQLVREEHLDGRLSGRRHGDAVGLPARGGQAAHGQRVQPSGAEHARRRRLRSSLPPSARCRTGTRFSCTRIRTRRRRPRPAASRVSSASGSIPRSWPTFPSRRSSSAAATWPRETVAATCRCRPKRRSS